MSLLTRVGVREAGGLVGAGGVGPMVVEVVHPHPGRLPAGLPAGVGAGVEHLIDQ